MGDGTVVEKDKDYPTGAFVFPSGRVFFGRYAGQSMGKGIATFTPGVSYSKYETCRASLAIILGSNNHVTEVLCLYHNTPPSPAGLLKAAGTVMGISQQDIQTLKKDVETFQQNCHDANITGTPVSYAHSLGVPTNESVLDSTNLSDPMQMGARVNFGGPTQPHGALNYVATTDLIPWVNPMNLIHAIITGFDDVTFINSFGQSPPRAHSFLGSSYQKALRDSFDNKGLYDE